MKRAALILRIALGINLLAFGIHQVLHPAYWYPYVPKFIETILPLPLAVDLRIHAAVNIVLGVLLLTGLMKKLVGWVAFLWMLSIAPLAFLHQWDIGVRDTVIACSFLAYSFLLTEKSSYEK